MCKIVKAYVQIETSTRLWSSQVSLLAKLATCVFTLEMEMCLGFKAMWLQNRGICCGGTVSWVTSKEAIWNYELKRSSTNSKSVIRTSSTRVFLLNQFWTILRWVLEQNPASRVSAATNKFWTLITWHAADVDWVKELPAVPHLGQQSLVVRAMPPCRYAIHGQVMKIHEALWAIWAPHLSLWVQKALRSSGIVIRGTGKRQRMRCACQVIRFDFGWFRLISGLQNMPWSDEIDSNILIADVD